MKWYDISEGTPIPGVWIVAELDRCKHAHYLVMKVREGEGLGHIKRWRFADPKIDPAGIAQLARATDL